jgi:nucleobase:cation symporter-1, NCS1 family
LSQISSNLVTNISDVQADIEQSQLFNADLAPVPASRRQWGMLSFAALWVSMCACIPTYMLASSLIGGGMNWWQAVLTIFLGNLIVLAPMILNAHAGTLYGIPFPVYCRAAFGTLGANVPAILRALVACGWFGIQTWIGGDAIYKIGVTIFKWNPAPATNWLGITFPHFLCFTPPVRVARGDAAFSKHRRRRIRRCDAASLEESCSCRVYRLCGPK